MHDTFRIAFSDSAMGRKHNFGYFLSSKVGNLQSKIVDIQVVSLTSGTEESQFNVKYSVVFFMYVCP
jgi:hypothetical protein